MPIDPKAGASGVRHIALESTGSTNNEALKLARGGERKPVWITAQRQSSGRGRRGSTWVSAPGNLYATLLLPQPSTPDVAPQLSFVAALALHDALSECAPQLGPMFKVKWPNDLLLGQDKLAGILIEGESAPAFAVAIGFGVNCVNHPIDTFYPATDLLVGGAIVRPHALFEALTTAMQRRLAQWQRGEGFMSIRADWMARAAGLGQDIRVKLPERELYGRFEGLDEVGRLLLTGSRGVEIVTAGEVFGMGGR
jgi:BirA family transcriptional regulator, biotin operon repressor / biotin---[acetyl-CoA-carboxylase] ligase